MEACATSLLAEPEYSVIVGVALRATRCAMLSGVCEHHSGLPKGGGEENGLLIVCCIHSGPPRVAPVESFDCVFCIVEVFCRVPDFIVF